MARRQQLKARVIDGSRVRSKTYTVDSREHAATRQDVKVDEPTKPIATRPAPLATPPAATPAFVETKRAPSPGSPPRPDRPPRGSDPTEPITKRPAVVPTPSTAKLLSKRKRSR